MTVTKDSPDVDEEIIEDVIEDTVEDTVEETVKETTPEPTVDDLTKAIAKVEAMEELLKSQAGMNIPPPSIANYTLQPGNDYEAPDFPGICKLVGKEFADTLKGFAKLKKMSKDDTEIWACKSWNYIMHMQSYHEDRAIVKYKTWIRNLRNVQLTL